MKQLLLYILFALQLVSCSNKYEIYKSHYTHSSLDGSPDYTDLAYWASHPWKWDPADSIPQPLLSEQRDSVVDVFFLHPTMYTLKRKMKQGKSGEKSWNARTDDHYNNIKTDYSAILYQASAFNQHGRVFAPRYREAHIKTFFLKDTARQQKIFDLAYSDIKTAFEYYLKNWNHNRPIIIAAHSQGSKHAERLLKEFFENSPLRKLLVAAYIPGWPVSKGYFTELKMCADPADINCLCSWRTYRKGYIPRYLKKFDGNANVTNPLNWKTDETYAGKQENKGAVLFKFNKIYPQTNDARISHGLLWIKRPKFPWSFLYFTRNYHPGDINLFYINIRENAAQRITAYFEKQQP